MSLITLSKSLESNADVSDIFQCLAQSFDSPVGLLETASISTKEHTNSVIMLSAAMRIRCFGQQVTIDALNANGRQALGILSESFTATLREDSRLVIEQSHEELLSQVEEDAKLSAPSVFDILRKVLAFCRCDHHDDKTTQLIGTFSFDCYQLFESLPEPTSEQVFPDYEFFLADTLVIIDHINFSQRLVVKVLPGSAQESIKNDYQNRIQFIQSKLSESASKQSTAADFPGLEKLPQPRVNISANAYEQWVERAKQHIIAGDVFQLVLARDFQLPCHNAFAAYQALKRSNPSPYMFFLRTEDYELFGASPESAVKFSADDRRLSIYPIAGTRRRGLTAKQTIDHDLDARIELELKNDEKEKAEHLMLVDLARNDIARVCVTGSRRIDRLLEIDRYSHVMHLVSKVSGHLKPQLDALSAYQACLNMGTLSGAPKVRATQLIREIEQQHRGVYGGAMGYLNAHGDMDTAIVIRSALVQQGCATVSAGAGIVYDSKATLEVLETENKAAAVLTAIARSNSLAAAVDQEAAHA